MSDSPGPQLYTGDWLPRPDPTKLTNELVDKAEIRLVDRLDRAIQSNEAITLIRLDLVHEQLNVVKAEIMGMQKLAEAIKVASDASGADAYRSFKDTLDKTSEGIGVRIAGFEAQMSEVKDKLIRLEQASITALQGRTEGRAKMDTNALLIMAAFAFVTILVQVGGMLYRPGSATPTAVATIPLNSSAVAGSLQH